MLIKHQTEILKFTFGHSHALFCRQKGGWLAFMSRAKCGFSRPPDFDAIRDEFKAYVIECLTETKERTDPNSPAAKWGEYPELEVRGIRFATNQSHGDQWRFEFFIVAKKSSQGT